LPGNKQKYFSSPLAKTTELQLEFKCYCSKQPRWRHFSSEIAFQLFFLNISGVIKSQTIALHISDKKTSLAAVIIIAIII